MQTIIPNELSFNLDLNDLPARSSVVEHSVLKVVEGGRVWTCKNRNKRFCGRVRVRWGTTKSGKVVFGAKSTAADARWACAQLYTSCCAGYTCSASNPR